jgi:PAS domain S-box-containing protein
MLDTHRTSEEGLDALFASAPVGLSELDQKGRFLRANHELCRILGRPLDEVLTLSVSDVTYPDDILPSQAALARALEESQDSKGSLATSVDKRCLRADGTMVWTNSTVTVLHDDEGQPNTFLVVTMDLTERKRFEEIMRQNNELLEARVQERTARLTETLEALEGSLVERQALTRRLVSAQEEERGRISRELHDQMGQLLTGFALHLKALEGQVAVYCPAISGAEAMLGRLHALTDEMGREVHRLAVDLRPPALDDIGLLPALRTYIAEWAERTRVAAVFTATRLEGRFSSTVETTVYRVVQEALTNAAKYAVPAGATEISVTLQRWDGQVQAIIEDNGPGFNLEEAQRAGRLGLAGMRERATLAGGTLEIETARGEGTTLFLRVPVAASAS